MRRFFDQVVRLRVLVLVVAVFSLLPALRVLPNLKSNNTITTFLAEKDPGLVYYQQVSEIFGGDHVVYVALAPTAGPVFDVGTLARLQEVSQALEALDGVEEVTSLTTTDAVWGEPGSVSVGPLMDTLPQTPEEVASLERKVLGSSLLKRFLAPDRSSTLAVVELDDDKVKDPTFENTVVRSIQRLLASEAGQGFSARVAGPPVIAEAIERYNARDQSLFSGLMLGVVALSAFILLRKVRGALLPIVVVLFAVIWTMGIFVAMGQQTNWVTSMITPMVLLLGVAETMHMQAHFQEVLPHSQSRREAVVRTMRELFWPCFFTNFTTAVGFLSLVTNQVMPVRVFGIYASVGVVLSFVAAFVVVPAILAFGRDEPPPEPTAAPVEPGPPRRPLLEKMDALAQAHPWKIVLGWTGALVPLAAGIFFIQVETNLLKYFEPDAPVVQDSLAIEGAFGGSSPLDIIVDTGRVDGALDPAVLRAVEALQLRMDAQPGMDPGLSLTDLVKELHGTLMGEPDQLRVPDTSDGVSQLLLLVDPEVLDPMVDPDRRMLRLSTRFEGAGAGLRKARDMLDQVEASAAAVMPPGLSVRLTGSSVLFIHMDQYLVWGQIQGLGLALLVLYLCMAAALKSLRIGLYSLIPNVVPIVGMLGFMGWARIPLDGFTVMIACIAMGIAVDDTIHYLHHLREELGQGHTLAQAMNRTIRFTGRSMMFNSIVLALGFWVFCLSDFPGTRNFGFLTGFTLILAMLGELQLTLATIRLMGVPREWR